MPKLLLFVPCERVIIEQGSNTISLISVFQELTPQLPMEQIPAEAAIPLNWFVATSWHLEDETERNREMEQSVVLEDPNAEIKAEARTAFRFEATKLNHRCIVNFRGFPIGVAGKYTIRLRLGDAGSELVEIATFPLRVVHQAAVAV